MVSFVRILAAAGALAGVCHPVAYADEGMAVGPVQWAGAYTSDIVYVSPGNGSDNAYYLDNLDLTADADLERLTGWRGARAHLYVLSNFGRRPNDRAATLQGIDNIEVPRRGVRLYEAWIEQQFGTGTSVLAGLYDLNSEFYANDAASVLLQPAFGIGTEFSATGPNGPSIFPSTALAVRINQSLGNTGYMRAAVFNADARTIGDTGGIDTSFRSGVLAIAEGGVDGDVKLAGGVWTYSKRQGDVLTGDADPRRARGAYFLAEAPLHCRDGGMAVRGFLRAGVSDGKTTDFRAAWQAGLLATKVISGRPDSVLTFGVNQAYLSRNARTLMRADGLSPARTETAFELSFADTLAPWLTLQPDMQLIVHPGGERDRRAAFVGGLRITLSASGSFRRR